MLMLPIPYCYCRHTALPVCCYVVVFANSAQTAHDGMHSALSACLAILFKLSLLSTNKYTKTCDTKAVLHAFSLKIAMETGLHWCAFRAEGHDSTGWQCFYAVCMLTNNAGLGWAGLGWAGLGYGELRRFKVSFRTN